MSEWPTTWDHCYESVVRDGIEEPCGRRPEGAARSNGDGHRDRNGREIYPVCRKHMKGGWVR